MTRKILVVDDSALNRALVANTLGEDYQVCEAANGREALELMERQCGDLSAVLLDIVMPEMDGYDVLRAVRDSSRLSQIPMIMVTAAGDEESRVRALSLGASDFIQKPFNPDIVRHCVKNNIALRETESKLNAIRLDKITGLYVREVFLERVSEEVQAHQPGSFILSCFDIDNFKLINDQYGTEEGDRILREIGRVVKEDMDDVGGIGGRISADNFAVLLPTDRQNVSIIRILQQNRMAFSDKQAITFSVGRYIITDTSLSAAAAYDRAYIAKRSVKGRYDEHMAYFTDKMLDELVLAQQMTDDTEKALAQRQFEVWFQPQHNHVTGALVGAEALARWRHPERGLIPPGVFIPVYEQNGFIYELDKYIWEETCRCLHKWRAEGSDPLPVSVNLSRYDVLRPDLMDVLTGLLDKYSIPVSLLRLEITESAFAKSTDMIVAIVQQLVDRGFTVEIDDFGSGYSSLNTLKCVPAQVLKLDMRFLEGKDSAGRGGNILESIVRMTKWLGMSVIAEGVEEKSQADYLASVGCSYIQGYYYARPMPAADYEEYCRNVGREERLLTMEVVASLDNNSFWEPKSMDTLIFNSYVGAACIFEYHNRNIELLRVNTKFTAILGDSTFSMEDTLKLDWLSCLMPESRNRVRAGLELSGRTGEEFTEEYELYNISGRRERTWLRSTMRVIARAGERLLVYCASENISAQRQAEENERETAARLALLNDSLPGGIAVYEGKPDAMDNVRLTYFNDGLCALFGYDREEYAKLALVNPMGLVFPEDLARMHAHIEALVHDGQPMDYVYRAKTKSGEHRWINVRAALGASKDEMMTVNAVFVDVTEQRGAMEKLHISEEQYRLAMQHSGMALTRFSVADRTLTVAAGTIKGFTGPLTDVPEGIIRSGSIAPETVDVYREFYAGILRGDKTGSMTYKRKTAQGWRWFASDFSTIFSDDGSPVSAVISSTDVTEQREKETVFKKWQQSLMDRDPKTYMLFRANISRNTTFDSVEGTLLPATYPDSLTTFDLQVAHYTQQLVVPEDRKWYQEYLRSDVLLARYYRGERADEIEYRELTASGGSRWVKCTMELVEYPDSADVACYLMYEDIDAEKRARLSERQRAESDPLTGLLNRKTFTEKMSEVMKSSHCGRSALFFVDLDGFKQVNDCFGHAVGDETLIEISRKLRGAFREQDLVCRLGGDEFMACMSDISSVSAVKDRAALVCALLHKSFSLEVQLSASVGIALCPDDGCDFDTLYHKADMALYHVKGGGKDGYALYSPEMWDEQITLEKAIAAPADHAAATRFEPKRRMLIVEDNEINRDYLESLFCDDFIVDTAAEGTAALTRLRRYGSGISIVLLDLVMPGMDGFAVLDQMRASPAMQSIPVIVVSGMSERESSLEAIRHGASDYVVKPVDGDLLRLRVNSALSRMENERLLAQNRYLAIQNEEAKRLAEAKRHSEELSVALHEAERADLAKTQFLSSMSHEIRTPLNAIIGYNTLARGELAEAHSDEERRHAEMKVADWLTKSDVATRHLLMIINDVLDMSAIESGKLKVERAPFDFRSLISSLTVMFFSQARSKGVGFEVLFDKPTDEWFVGDQLRINQVLTNLLSNAVKFTPEGGQVTLSITETESDGDSASFRFVVADTGIGMTREYLTHIWTPFEQAEASISRRFGGTGLGLSITKNLVELMGGDISVESESGVGSSFIVDLTLARTEQPERRTCCDFSDVNALIVDDDACTCDYIQMLFDRVGARCDAFTSGETAVAGFAAAKERGQPFNICLVDWRMPKMDGFETIREIRRIADRDLPIVVVTAYDFTEVAERAAKLNINRFLSKPLFQSSLYDLLANIGGKPTAQSASAGAKYDFDGARVLLVEDNNMNMEVAKRILLSAKLAVDSAWNGQEAFDIFSASRPGAYKVILMDVHMPVVDGYEATRMIRMSKHPDAQTIPIIAMTADVFAEDVAEARGAGMNDHIAKPIELDALFIKLASYIDKDGGTSK